MNAPCYSIITVCLNAKEDLKKTLQSIEQQTFENFEWIIVDGGSIDGTIELIQTHPRVNKLISEPDEGIYDAMNKGINVASGEYLLFLNAGDWLYRKETLSQVEKNLQDDLVVGNMMVIKYGKMILKEYKKFGINKNYLYYRSFPHQSTFIKNKLFDKYGLYNTDFKICGDYDFFTRLFRNNVSFSFLNFCVSVFPVNGLSFQMKNSKLLKREISMVRKNNFDLLFRVKMLLYTFANDTLKRYHLKN